MARRRAQTNITGFDEATKRSLMESGESVESVVFRGTAAFDWLKSIYPETRIVIFSHGPLIRLLLSDLYGKAHPCVANGEVTEFGINLIQEAGVRGNGYHNCTKCFRGCLGVEPRILGINFLATIRKTPVCRAEPPPVGQ